MKKYEKYNVEATEDKVKESIKDISIVFDYIYDDDKTRYSTKSAKAKIIQENENIKVVFDEPQRAITPGQSAVFYDDDIVIGGGKIVYGYRARLNQSRRDYQRL